MYNTVFFGEAYANFGSTGVLISPFVVLMNYFALIYFAQKMSKKMAIAFLVHTALTFIMMAGFNDYLWNPFLIANILFLISLDYVSQLGSVRQQ